MCAEWVIRCGITARIFVGEAMTQIGEPVKASVIAGRDNECPFNHDFAKPPVVENVFKGDAPTLERYMGAGTSTIDGTVPDSWRPSRGPGKSLCPNYDDDHAFFDDLPEEKYPVVIEGNRYPVTCAPHHLIPAQESLKHTKLVKYMIWKDKAEPVTNGKPRKGLCFSDLGYNVNGRENGMFLPGSYGVTSVGTGDWTSTASAMPGESWEDESTADNEAAAVKARPRKTHTQKLTGLRHQVSPSNRKWAYVRQAVSMAPGQFHDRHIDYSREVTEALDAIAREYDAKVKRIKEKSMCKRCQKRFDEFEKQGLPTPFKLLSRLNKVSSRYASWLSGSKWAMNIYTSKWGLAYMRAVKSGRPVR